MKLNHNQTAWSRAAVLGCIALLYLILSAVGIGCPILFVTGIPCLGCGMTRAVWSALHLNFAAAFAFHPLWVLLPPMGLMLLAGERVTKGVRRVFWGTAALAFAGIYLVRLLVLQDLVLPFQLHSGLIGRIFLWVRGAVTARL